MDHKTKILMTEFVTHDVKRFVIEKPNGYTFTPGQATDVSIDADGWRDKRHPFTFASLVNDLTLEFVIKCYLVSQYPEHDGMTEKLSKLKPGDGLIIQDPWGTIQYKGPGVFIAGGAGVTPFIAILRDLRDKGKLGKNFLIFSNKTARDVILEKEFREMLGERLVLTLTREKREGYEQGHIDASFLKKHVKDFSQNFYICGPTRFVDEMKAILASLGAKADAIVFEE